MQRERKLWSLLLLCCLLIVGAHSSYGQTTPEEVKYTVPYFDELDYLNWGQSACGPTSITMLLHYYYPNSTFTVPEIYHSGTQNNTYQGPLTGYRNVGFQPGSGQTASDTGLDRVPTEFRANYGNVGNSGFVWDAGRLFFLPKKLGFEVKSLPDYSWQTLKDTLKEGPFIARVEEVSGFGHIVVVTGYLAESNGNEWVYINDPFFPYVYGYSSRGADYPAGLINRKVSRATFEGWRSVRQDNIIIRPPSTHTQEVRDNSALVDNGSLLLDEVSNFVGPVLQSFFSVDSLSARTRADATKYVWQLYHAGGIDYAYTLESGHWARWNPVLRQSGAYVIKVRTTKRTNSSTTVRYSVRSSSGQELRSVVVDQSLATGQEANVEFDLGLYTLTPGAYVEVSDVPPNSAMDVVAFDYVPGLCALPTAAAYQDRDDFLLEDDASRQAKVFSRQATRELAANNSCQLPPPLLTLNPSTFPTGWTKNYNLGTHTVSGGSSLVYSGNPGSGAYYTSNQTVGDKTRVTVRYTDSSPAGADGRIWMGFAPSGSVGGTAYWNMTRDIGYSLYDGYASSGGQFGTFTGLVPLGTQHTLAIERDGNTTRFFADGVLKDTRTVSMGTAQLSAYLGFENRSGSANATITVSELKVEDISGTSSPPPPPAVPTITNFGAFGNPTAGLPFDGGLTGTGFASNLEVWFCDTATGTGCYQHPSAGVAVTSATQASATAINLTVGSWKVKVRNGATGAWSNFSNSFTVQAVPPPTSSLFSEPFTTFPSSTWGTFYGPSGVSNSGSTFTLNPSAIAYYRTTGFTLADKVRIKADVTIGTQSGADLRFWLGTKQVGSTVLPYYINLSGDEYDATWQVPSYFYQLFPGAAPKGTRHILTMERDGATVRYYLNNNLKWIKTDYSQASNVELYFGLENRGSVTGTIQVFPISVESLTGSSTPPTTLSCSVSPNPAQTSQQVTWSCQSVANATVTWSGSLTSTSWSAFQTYPSSGSYTATATVRDGQGATLATWTGTVQVNAPASQPLAADCLASPNPVQAGQATSLSCSNFRNGTAGYGVNWSGAVTVSGNFASVTFPSAGSYSVTPTIFDSAGRSQSLTPITVTVTQPAGPPPLAAYTLTLFPQSIHAGQRFLVTFSGSGITDQTQVVVSGPGCPPCVAPLGDRQTYSSTAISWYVQLNTVGTYFFSLRQGSSGTPVGSFQVNLPQ